MAIPKTRRILTFSVKKVINQKGTENKIVQLAKSREPIKKRFRYYKSARTGRIERTSIVDGLALKRALESGLVVLSSRRQYRKQKKK